MGRIRHNTIVVTSAEYLTDYLRKAHRKAKKIFPYVSPISHEGINGYRSFFVPPDGSKEGWRDSAVGDRKREEFMNWCSNKYKSGEMQNFLEIIDVSFGEEPEYPARIEREIQ